MMTRLVTSENDVPTPTPMAPTMVSAGVNTTSEVEHGAQYLLGDIKK